MSAPLGAIVVGTGFGVLTHLRALRAAGFEVWTQPAVRAVIRALPRERGYHPDYKDQINVQSARRRRSGRNNQDRLARRR